ncbi:hypothetical protein PML95_10080 (plasmid) [Vagococcus lutrae]|uniref:Uncharacterized protein n=1 Tax=Vagococcus lutrae TaxID=81947 RepID=A0AAE9XMY1_9ENTE|nr:hypothetical protein [Vagococcus lutrae]MDO5741786.1 hypothetical protein [Vagococcus sp.]MCO7151756.1 hypothetical protein [Vagococcus lutrae]MDT2818654.1 hypothetical protein [Vagococcus lutrae]MDT2843778.1 hypothetical protein [Vagococcus lutrae]UQF11368.1 hypothetical protein M2919_07690 [Vagococcus lutrae]
MDLEKIVEGHGKKLDQHDREIGRINDVLVEMQRGMNEGLARVDESNRFLREQNTRQSEQNIEILNAVLSRNEKSEERVHELKKISRENTWKLILMISGASGLITYILNLIFGG